MNQKVVPEWSSTQAWIYEIEFISPDTQLLALQLKLSVLESWCPFLAVPPGLHGVTVRVTSSSV